MLRRIPKLLLLVALLAAFVASSAPVFSKGGDHDFCDFTTLEPTNCITRPDGSCFTQKCDNPFLNCIYSRCARK